jgi:CO/xanthine dehydrogenase FAD-binding subunit
MNLNTITALRRPSSATEIAEWRDGFAWLAGGTWLFSEPQPATDTLIDLGHLDWATLEASPAGLEIGATCRIAELYRFEAPKGWIAAPLIRACCDALLASFKIWNAATVGGNVCMSLPAGAMISLVAALEGRFTLCRAPEPRAKYRRSILSPATILTSCAPVNCCARCTCPLRRSRSELCCAAVPSPSLAVPPHC